MMTTGDLLEWCRQIAEGMEFVSAKCGIVHGDLALRNILLSNDKIAKIGDFGLGQVISTRQNVRPKSKIDKVKDNEEEDSPQPCLPWMPPEVLNDIMLNNPTVLSTKTDVWSYGVLVWEVFSLAVEEPYQR